MTNLFQDSSSIKPEDVHDKILFWGPQHTGKTHVLLGWPDLALADAENRAAHFADRFRFKIAPCRSIEDLEQIAKALLADQIPCETIAFDSGSAIYLKFVELYTKLGKGGRPVTDYVSVNKRFLSFINFVFSIAGKNVIFTMHAGDKLIRNGEDFRNVGQQFVGDDRFRYAFDYIFRIESQGDPRVKAPIFHVEKSASPNLKIGDKVVGLNYQKFIEITRPQIKPEPEPPTTITEAQAQWIDDYVEKHRISKIRLADLVKQVSRRRTPVVRDLTLEEGPALVALLQKEPRKVS
jgi:hypothetical protein